MSMQLDAELIDRIVREVIRRLLEMEAGADGKQNGAELRLSEKLVTLETLRGRLSGVQRIIVARRAVVTPAVRDELKDNCVELVRNES